MGSSFKLKNAQDQEFSIVHNDNAGAITVASDKIVVKDVSGNVGIGTNSPTLTGAADKALHIHANTEGQLHLTTTNTGSTSNDGSVISVASNNNLYLFNKENASVIIGTNNNEKVTVDSSGNLLLTSGSGGLGYGTGAGGTVIQSTSKSTAVTLNKPTGQITMNNAALAAGATVAFSFNNSLIINAADNISVCGYNSISMTNYNVWAANNGTGSVVIHVKNISAGSLSEAIIINFSITKGAIA